MTQPWMLDCPNLEVSADWLGSFQVALAQRNADFLRREVPIWLFLRWLAEQGFLLHGSPLGKFEILRPARKDYRQPDAFSNRAGVYATSDALWAMMYALRGPDAAGQKDMCLRLQTDEGWSARRYYYALGTDGGSVDNPRSLLASGWVYVLDPGGFKPSPPYQHGSLGLVQEMHWVCCGATTPLMAIIVEPEDFPLPVDTYDLSTTRAQARANPWGFPWLDE